jgi:uncharacterized membrane protein YkoI
MQDTTRLHHRRLPAGGSLAAVLVAIAPGCSDSNDSGTPTSTPPGQGGLSEPEEVREEISSVVSGGNVDLVGAIEAAEARAEGTAIEMQVSVRRDGGVFYDADVVAQDTVHDVELDIDTMDVLRSTTEPGDASDAADAALAQDADWAALIAAAEAEVGGNAFEIEADGSTSTFEVEVLVDNSVVWEVVLNPDATIVRTTRDDAGGWADDQLEDN